LGNVLLPVKTGFVVDLLTALSRIDAGLAVQDIVRPVCFWARPADARQRARRRRNARVPVDIWRKPSGPTASGNMSFSHCPARPASVK
jgi:hypothetical protein